MGDNAKKMRLIYLGNSDYIHAFKSELLKIDDQILFQQTSNTVTLTNEILKKILPISTPLPQITLQFYCDIHELVKNLPDFYPDIILVDERQNTINGNDLTKMCHLPKENPLNSEKVLQLAIETDQSKQKITFENLESAIEKFTPRNFKFTLKRILVILSQEEHASGREFNSRITQVRGVIVDPPNFLNLLGQISKNLILFYQNHSKKAICFSGGGLEGYLYSIGVAYALVKSFANGKTCRDFDIFTGVSSGAVLASSLASGIPIKSLILQLTKKDSELEHLSINTFYDLATREMILKAFRFIKAFSTRDVEEIISRFQDAIPIGFFKGEKIKIFLERQIERLGLKNNFLSLNKELYISATDQDTGENIIFGEEPWKDIKISQAVRASTAVPPFYLPEKINGHWFNDGQITGGSGLEHALKKGAGLIVNIDPMVAYTSNLPGALMKRGGYFTLIQSFKSLVQTRANSILNHSMDKHPDIDFINFQPTGEIMEALAGNPMKYQIKVDLVETSFKCTKNQILNSYDSISFIFQKHGFELKSKDEIKQLSMDLTLN